jgi:indole-3-acetate monooxygenase
MDTRNLVDPVAEDILRLAPQAEAERQLPPALMERLVHAGLFSIYTPREFGGLDLPLPRAQSIVEEVARLDGSVGWVVALGIHNAIFTAGLHTPTASQILKNGSALLAGAPGPMVKAVPVEGGFRLTGQWAFCSGAPNATFNVVAAPIFDGEGPRTGPAGPEMIGAIMPAGQAEIVDTWHTMGMRGTGSHDLRVDDLFVPAEMTAPFSLAGIVPVRESLIARIPLMTALTIGLTPPVCLGITRRAIEEFRKIACGKQRGPGVTLSDQVQAQMGLARAEAEHRASRAYWYKTVEELWDRLESGYEVTPQDQVDVRLAALTVAENSVSAVDILARQAGTTGIFQSSDLGRCWRDVHTITQHMHVQDARWETCGRVLLGKEPASPFV